MFKDEGGGGKRESQEGVSLLSLFPLFSVILPYTILLRLILALQRF